MSLVDEIEARLEQDVDDVEAWLVYADLLQNEGDPLGELIAYECAQEREPDRVLQAHLYEAFEATKRRALGALADRKELVCRFRFGFVREVWLLEDHAAVLESLLSLRAARFLRSVAIEHAEEEDLARCLSRIPGAGKLRINAPEGVGRERLAQLMDRRSWDRLEELYLVRCELGATGIFALADVRLPSLRRFTAIRCADEPPDGRIEDLFPKWPLLESVIFEPRFARHDEEDAS